MNTNTITVREKQPPGLIILFLTEMWERFGFYIVQGLLILYMTKRFGFSDDKGYTILGAFTALAYIAPIIGGFIADHVLGFRYAIIVGNILLVIGYALLVFHGEPLLYFSLAMIVVGVGFLKPNISSIVGSLYQKNDSRREAGFTIFYMGINIGVLLATSISGFIQQKFGWHASFGLAAIGLVIGLITFVSGMRLFGKQGLPPTLDTIDNSLTRFLRHKAGFLIAMVAFIACVWALITHNKIANLLLTISGVSLLVGLFYLAIRFSQTQRNKLLALIVLILVSVVFWAIYFQMFFSVNLFIERDVNRQIFGYEIPTVMFIGLESLFIFILGPVMAIIWRSLSEKNKNPSLAIKFALASLFAGLGFLWLIIGIHNAGDSGLTSPLWIVIAYLFITIGELLLSPIGLSMVTTLSPSNLVGMMMGVWFIALGFGGKLAGVIAKSSSIPQGIIDRKVESLYYAHAFTSYFFYGVAVAVLILVLTPVLRKWERGENAW